MLCIKQKIIHVHEQLQVKLLCVSEVTKPEVSKQATLV